MNCPACLQPLNAVTVDRVDLGACRHCGGLWFPRRELLELAAQETVQSVIDAARGKPGRCMACSERIVTGATCPRCERKAPACPDCGRAPLALGNARGVNVDVCPDCSGIWLDPGELQLVAGRTAEVMRVQRGAFRSTSLDESSGRVTCSACNERLAKTDAFQKDDLFYCGSCCPTGAAPVVRIHGSLASTVSTSGHGHDGLGGDSDAFVDLFRFFGERLR